MPFAIDDSQVPGTPDYRGNETILVVDDDIMSRELLAIAMRTYGYAVLEAVDGEDAITQIERYGAPIHLVITDIVMPNLGGVALSDMVRRWYPSSRVLFMSGYEHGEMAALARQDERTSFIAKPFHVKQLAAAVRRLLDAPSCAKMTARLGENPAIA